MASPMNINKIDTTKITLGTVRRRGSAKFRSFSYNDKPLLLKWPEMLAPFGPTQFSENDRYNLCVYLDEDNEQHGEIKKFIEDIQSLVKDETDADVRDLIKPPTERYEARIDLTLDVTDLKKYPDIRDLEGELVDELKPNSTVQSIIHVQHVYLKGSVAFIKLSCVAIQLNAEPEQGSPLELCANPFFEA
tara:strand:+ start:105 stop:674 length:570 start_codon:yes stop_codon:yes gene_type:complete